MPNENGAAPENEQQQQQEPYDLVLTIRYRTRDGECVLEASPQRWIEQRRDVIHAALSRVEEHLHYLAATEKASQAIVQQQKKAEVEAMRNRLSRG